MEPVWNVKITNYQIKMAIRWFLLATGDEATWNNGEKRRQNGVFRHGHRRIIRLTINVRCLGDQIPADRFLKCPYHEMNDDWLLKWWMCYTCNDIINGSVVKDFSIHVCHNVTLTISILYSHGVLYGQKYVDILCVLVGMIVLLLIIGNLNATAYVYVVCTVKIISHFLFKLLFSIVDSIKYCTSTHTSIHPRQP